MKLAKILILCIISVFLIGLVHAELGVDESPLSMNVDAKVDGKSAGSSLSDGEDITREANPESSVKVTVNFENIYDKDSQPYSLEDLEITATLEAIEDEGDEDIELEGSVSRIRAEGTGKETFTFEVPLVVDEGSYNLNIEVEYDDENPNATLDSKAMTLTLNIEKEKHEIIINKAELSRSSIECITSSTLNVEIMNLGQEEEDETVLEIVSDSLKINIKDSDIDLSEDPFDEDNTYSKTVSIDAKGLAAGTYPITIKAYRNTDSLEATKNIELVVLGCKEEVKEEEEKKPEIVVSVCGNGIVETGEECDDSNKVNGDGCSYLCRIETSPVVPVSVEEENFWDKYGTTSMIIVGELIFLFIVLIIVAIALRRK